MSGAALLFPWRSFAAVLTVAPSAGNPGMVTISLDTQGQTVNAVEAHFSFDTSLFAIGSVDTAGSIINLWVSGPTFSNASGTLDLAGIIPGGETTADGVIATIAIVPKEPGVATSFTLDSAQALLNDGQGTPAALSVVSDPFATGVTMGGQTAVSTQAPNAFTPEIGQDPNIFSGQYFIVFATTDQGSSIDHYDVLEVPAGTKVTSSSVWTIATSPYRLNDQTLSSDIYVRAVDSAGNFRVEELPATQKSSKTDKTLDDVEVLLGAIVVLLIMGGIIRRIRKWKRRKRSRDSG